MREQTELDTRLFRDVMGRFATGVTIVTVNDGEERRGMTANAFSSLSLDPPLMLVCVKKDATSHALMERSDHFAVNILADDQRPLSDLFARHLDYEEPMAGAIFRDGVTGAPILDGVLAYAECRITERYPGGDHTIVVGEAIDIAILREDAEPLIFFAGQYRTLDGPA